MSGWDDLDHPRARNGEFTVVRHAEGEATLEPDVEPDDRDQRLDWLTAHTMLLASDSPQLGVLRDNVVLQVAVADVTVDELEEAHAAAGGKDRHLAGYLEARLRWSHTDLISVRRAGVELASAALLARAGATFDEVLDARRAQLDISVYYALRWHCDHAEAMRVGAMTGIDHFEYGIIRSCGATEEEAIAANRAGVDQRRYGDLRERGRDHFTAVQRTRPIPGWPPPSF